MTTTTLTRPPDVDGLVSVLRDKADHVDAARRLPADVVEMLRDRRLFGIHTPAELGGLQLDPRDSVTIIETLARGDGSVGWCTMIGAGTNALAARLPEDAARQLFASAGGRDIITGGTFHPRGQVVALDGGYRLTGRWSFVSGAQHADWLCGAAMVPSAPSGPLEHRLLFFPSNAATIIDTWRVVGLRGTGSQDVEVDDVFVPADHTMSLSDLGWAPSPLSRMPGFSNLLPCMAAVSLGLARAAIDQFVELASAKTPYRSSRLLSERETIQTDMAKCEASLRSARAFLFETLTDNWNTVCAGDELTMQHRALGRLAAVNAAHAAAGVVDTCYNAAGGSSIYDGAVLQRVFRDVHTATQHVAVSAAGYETVGRVLFGLEPDTPLL